MGRQAGCGEGSLEQAEATRGAGVLGSLGITGYWLQAMRGEEVAGHRLWGPVERLKPRSQEDERKVPTYGTRVIPGHTRLKILE